MIVYWGSEEDLYGSELKIISRVKVLGVQSRKKETCFVQPSKDSTAFVDTKERL